MKLQTSELHSLIILFYYIDVLSLKYLKLARKTLPLGAECAFVALVCLKALLQL
jgi:hypothetical protein